MVLGCCWVSEGPSRFMLEVVSGALEGFISASSSASLGIGRLEFVASRDALWVVLLRFESGCSVGWAVVLESLCCVCSAPSEGGSAGSVDMLAKGRRWLEW